MNASNIFTPSLNAEGTAVIHGVNVRLTDRSVKAAPLFRKQRIVTEVRTIESGDYVGNYIKATMRFDDECGNGHNSFSITGEINANRSFSERGHVASGCIHEEIAAHFPELAHLIKWHLCSTDSPMHYVANTVYHASDRDHNGKRKGEPTRFEENLYFGDFPVSFGGKKLVREFLKDKLVTDVPIFDFELEVMPIPHSDKNRPGKHQFNDKYSFAGCVDKGWTYAPFDSFSEAEQWAKAIKLGYRFDRVPVAWSEGKERDFNAARNTGVWPDATDEQLSMEPELLKAALLERLPALIEAMKSDITGAGFIWAAE